MEAPYCVRAAVEAAELAGVWSFGGVWLHVLVLGRESMMCILESLCWRRGVIVFGKLNAQHLIFLLGNMLEFL